MLRFLVAFTYVVKAKMKNIEDKDSALPTTPVTCKRETHIVYKNIRIYNSRYVTYVSR